jgi:outer membrane lipoprotein-sorting protein
MNSANERIGCRNECFFERINYYYGQMMTEHDFRDQQRYYNEKRWMLNRYVVGCGVLHGLEVSLKPTETCSSQNIPSVWVDPGFALDQYGNEIIVCQKQVVNVSELLESVAKSNDKPEQQLIKKVYLAVQYHEYGIEPFRLPDKICCCLESDCAYSRTKETCRFVASTNPWPTFDDEEILTDEYGCQIDGIRDLQNPKAANMAAHPERKKNQPIPIASMTFCNNKWVIDNYSTRDITYSNYQLGRLVSNITDELCDVHAAGNDRRAHVPLLSQTIPGLVYRDGLILRKDAIGDMPFRVTTDGNSVWFTDRNLNKVHVLKVKDTTCKQITLDNSKGWGIAYDGHYMWVTLTEKNKLASINICTHDVKYVELTGVKNPQEIVYDGKYMWISSSVVRRPKVNESKDEQIERNENEIEIEHKKGKEKHHDDHPDHNSTMLLYITRFDPRSHALKTYEIKTGDEGCSSSIIGMAFDGKSIWITYNDKHSRAVTVPISTGCKDLKESSMSIDPGNPLILRGNKAQDIAFDGTHIWVVHSDGVSKVDTWTKTETGSSNDRGHLSSIVFDGKEMWLVQNRENENEIRRCDLYMLNNKGGYELQSETEKIVIGRMCFDGTYIWLAGQNRNCETNKGVIYRIIP